MTSAAALLAAFVGGLATAASPCVLAAMPVAVGFVGGRAQSRGQAWTMSIAMAVGMTAALTALGLVAARTGSLMGGLPLAWHLLVAAVVVMLGLWIGSGRAVPALAVPPGWQRRCAVAGVPGAAAIGALLGTVMTPCATPALAAALAVAGSTGASGTDLALGGGLLAAYGLGHSALLLVAGPSPALAAACARWSTRLQRGVPGRRTFATVIVAAGCWLAWQALDARSELLRFSVAPPATAGAVAQ